MRVLPFFLIAILFTIHSQGQATGQFATYTSSGSGGSTIDGQVNSILGPIQEANSKLGYKEQNLQGSPYSTDLFLPTSLFYGDEFMGDLFYRYNAYNEEVEIKKTNSESEGVRALGRDKKIAIMVNGKPMRFSTFIDKDGLTQNGYLTKLKEGKYAVYKRVNVKFTEGQKAQNSFIPAVPARFSKYDEYYIEKEGGNRIDELELNNRKLLKLVANDKKESLKQFLKENRMKIKDENTLFKVIDFLNNQTKV